MCNLIHSEAHFALSLATEKVQNCAGPDLEFFLQLWISINVAVFYIHRKIFAKGKSFTFYKMKSNQTIFWYLFAGHLQSRLYLINTLFSYSQPQLLNNLEQTITFQNAEIRRFIPWKKLCRR